MPPVTGPERRRGQAGQRPMPSLRLASGRSGLEPEVGDPEVAALSHDRFVAVPSRAHQQRRQWTYPGLRDTRRLWSLTLIVVVRAIVLWTEPTASTSAALKPLQSRAPDGSLTTPGGGGAVSCASCDEQGVGLGGAESSPALVAEGCVRGSAHATQPLYDGRAPSGDSIVVEPRSERWLFGVDAR